MPDAIDRAQEHAHVPSTWTATDDKLPKTGKPVLVFVRGKVRIGELRWETPTWEESFSAFRYWDDPEEEGQEWEWHDVTHWTPLPKPPEGSTAHDQAARIEPGEPGDCDLCGEWASRLVGGACAPCRDRYRLP